ncbi:MAG: hypothetical protein ACOCXZ_02140 [Chloroflexota bacterium]
MRVKLNRNHCPATLSYCERCFGKFLLHPLGYERRCFEAIEDDGNDRLIIEMTTGSRTVTFRLNDEQREILAREGWANFVNFAVPFYREEVEPPVA